MKKEEIEKRKEDKRIFIEFLQKEANARIEMIRRKKEESDHDMSDDRHYFDITTPPLADEILKSFSFFGSVVDHPAITSSGRHYCGNFVSCFRVYIKDPTDWPSGDVEAIAKVRDQRCDFLMGILDSTITMEAWHQWIRFLRLCATAICISYVGYIYGF